ncbi:winged helix-turn-helix transcriptional regulator [Streptomyces sp. NPDC059568]|uniref:winged helix-turn-helix transcriptional regulator n=1 Tax=Streptomyces sp. NPDC059568 TaxID=3346868 RepID=UPI0036BBA33F
MTTPTTPLTPAAAGYEAYFQDCPAVALLSAISNRWVSLVLCVLGAKGQLRYGQIGREIPAVSQKMLTQTLRTLERDGIVSRTVTPTIPPRVDYDLTPLGRSLYYLLSGVRDWAWENIEDVNDARKRYDQEHTATRP